MPMPMHFWLVGIDLEAGGMNISEAHQRCWSPFPIRDLILGTLAGLPRTRRALEVFSRKRLKHGSSKTPELLWPDYFHRGGCFLEALSAIITFENTYISIPGLIIPRPVYDYMHYAKPFSECPFCLLILSLNLLQNAHSQSLQFKKVGVFFPLYTCCTWPRSW